MSRFLTACTAVLFAALVSTVSAQDSPLPMPASAPANLAFVDGAVDLTHDGSSERATAGTMLLDGDVVRTSNGRAEIVFGDGTLLHLDHDTDLEILSPVRLRLREGRVLLRVSAAAAGPYVIDTQAASIDLQSRGEYGVSASGRFERLEVTVARGIAELDDRGARTLVRAGEMATILGVGGRVLLQPFNSARWDAFELWASDRTNGFAAAPAARQLPVELRPYGPVLDSYGRWDYMAPYGNVWFPAVGASWRPYYTGAWVSTRYGYTWIGNDPWSWPTHHYGRWGHTGASWYWIPNRVWGPAWVSFNFVSNYVSWCPLGFDGRPVFSFYGPGRLGDHRDYRPNYDPWRGWTVAPRNSFGGRRAVHTYAVEPHRLPDETRRAMSHAVPRGTGSLPARANAGPAAGAAPSNYAVPRGTTAPAAPRGGDAAGNDERRGNVRAPDAERNQAPRVNAPRLDSPRVESPRVESPRAESPRAETAAADPPRVYSPGAYRRPENARPARPDQPRSETPARAEPPARQERPARAERPAESERPQSQGGRATGVAVPRSGAERSQERPSSGGTEQGGARRRPR